jgi:hypothetical protein
MREVALVRERSPRAANFKPRRNCRVAGGEVGDDETGNEPSDGVRVSGRRLIEGQFRWGQQRRSRRRFVLAIAVLREA